MQSHRQWRHNNIDPHSNTPAFGYYTCGRIHRCSTGRDRRIPDNTVLHWSLHYIQSYLYHYQKNPDFMQNECNFLVRKYIL